MLVLSRVIDDLTRQTCLDQAWCQAVDSNPLASVFDRESACLALNRRTRTIVRKMRRFRLSSVNGRDKNDARIVTVIVGPCDKLEGGEVASANFDVIGDFPEFVRRASGRFVFQVDAGKVDQVVQPWAKQLASFPY